MGIMQSIHGRIRGGQKQSLTKPFDYPETPEGWNTYADGDTPEQAAWHKRNGISANVGLSYDIMTAGGTRPNAVSTGTGNDVPVLDYQRPEDTKWDM